MTLTHSETLDWADSATDKPKSHGLTKFGEEVVAEMNRLGMLVDISHVSADTMRHALRVAQAPVIASHSSAFALADHPRNVPDDVLKLVAKNGGVVMVNFYPGFLTPEAARVAQEDVRRDPRAEEEVPGREGVQGGDGGVARRSNPIPPAASTTSSITSSTSSRSPASTTSASGSDYDGIGSTPEGLEDVSCYPYITQELLNRGYKKEQIVKMLGGNVLRALRDAEKVAKK